MERGGAYRGGRGGRGGHRGGREVTVSKSMSWILRHGAVELGLEMGNDGYVSVTDMLQTQRMKQLKVTLQDLMAVVESNDKKRFQMKSESDPITQEQVFYIRAVQGHTIKTINDEELLEEIKDPFIYEEVIHGTYLNCIQAILKTGLNKMARNHIHMALGMPGKKGVVSGMRGSCEVLVEVNMPRAILQGKVPFYISQNRVILSPGLNGELPSAYFRSVIDMKKKEFLYQAPFDYICVYDFECQCEEGTKNLTFNEIIEFPVVIIDVKAQKVVAEFQTYVKPTLHPELTEFCTKLTGIEQKQVDEGVTIKEAIQLVHEFLGKNGVLESEFVFLSCGDFDGNQMRREALHKGFDVPNYLKRWINIKKVFPKHLFDEKAAKNEVIFVKDVKKSAVSGMPHMLELCGLELEGRHHSGIDDCKNIARCAIKCLQEGFQFTQGMVLSHPFSIDEQPQSDPNEESKE